MSYMRDIEPQHVCACGAMGDEECRECGNQLICYDCFEKEAVCPECAEQMKKDKIESDVRYDIQYGDAI